MVERGRECEGKRERGVRVSGCVRKCKKERGSVTCSTARRGSTSVGVRGSCRRGGLVLQQRHAAENVSYQHKVAVYLGRGR